MMTPSQPTFVALRDAGQRVAGQGNHGNVLRALVDLDATGGFPAVHSGERQVHQDDVWRQLDSLIDGIETVGRFGDAEAGKHQYSAHLRASW